MRREALFPAELTSDIPCVTFTGRSLVHIEQHKGLIAFDDERILLRTGIGPVCVQGKGLGFRRYTAQDVLICGDIDCITMDGGAS